MSIFIPTTVVTPATRPFYINRPLGANGLTESIANARLLAICAPAGYGKTTAAQYFFSQLVSQGRPGLWIAARAGAYDLGTFLMSLREAGIAAGLPWEDLGTDGDHSVWYAALTACTIGRPVIVVDDAQLLSKEVMSFLSQAISSGRDAITTVIVSRGAVAMPLARLRSMGFLVEIGPAELGFNTSEATELVSRILGGAKEYAVVQDIVESANGWAAGLVIAANHIRRKIGNDAELTLENNFYLELISYFYEEVLAGLPEKLRNFIIDTSILDELTSSACVAVTQDDSAPGLLDATYLGGLFLEKSERNSGAYAWHSLFQKSIISVLKTNDSARYVELNKRASCFYAELGEGLIAFEHARLSADQQFIAAQLDRLANGLVYDGFLYRIDSLASEISWSELSKHPMLLLAMSWKRIRGLSFSSAERFINAAAEIAQTRPDDFHLKYLIRHRRIMLEAARDNMVFVEQEAQKLLDDLGDSEPYLSCTLLAQLMSARRELYHFNDILKLESETRSALERSGPNFASIALKSTSAPTFAAQGKTTVATRLLEEALVLAEEHHGKGSGLAALPALPFAEILYDKGELKLAEDLIDKHIQSARIWGFVDQLAAGYLVRAKLASARGDQAMALSGLEEAHLVAIECGLGRLRTLVVAEQVQILTRSGDVEGAKAALRCGDINIKREPMPSPSATRKDEAIALAWLRIELLGPKLVSVEKVVMRWLEFVKKSSAVRSVVVFQLLIAEIAVLRGDRAKARRALRKAIELAEPAGWTQIFVDGGAVIASLLKDTYCNEAFEEPTSTDIFASQLAAKMNDVVSAGPGVEEEEDECVSMTSNLSGREVGILKMVNSGLRNREIGDRLGLTEGTVKWYMQQIYDKLGVRRRTQVVIRARQLGLLD